MSSYPRYPPGSSPDELMRALAAQGAELDAFKASAYAWSEPTARQLIYAIDTMCDVALNPRHPGQLPARKLLEAFVKVVRRAETTVAGISVISAPLPAHNGEGS